MQKHQWIVVHINHHRLRTRPNINFKKLEREQQSQRLLFYGRIAHLATIKFLRKESYRVDQTLHGIHDICIDRASANASVNVFSAASQHLSITGNLSDVVNLVSLLLQTGIFPYSGSPNTRKISGNSKNTEDKAQGKRP